MTKLGHPLKILGISSKAVQLACEPTPSTTATRTCTSAAVGGEATGYNSRRVLHNFGAANACSFGPQDQYGTHQHATFQPYMPSKTMLLYRLPGADFLLAFSAVALAFFASSCVMSCWAWAVEGSLATNWS